MSASENVGSSINMPRVVSAVTPRTLAVLDVRQSVDLSSALRQYAGVLRKDAAMYSSHGNDPLAENTLRTADTFERLSEVVFATSIAITEAP